MNKIFAFSLAFALFLSVPPAVFDAAQAKSSIEDLVKANCTKAFMASASQVDRAEVAGFQLTKNGDGYSYGGLDENKHFVSCLAAADGHVTWING